MCTKEKPNTIRRVYAIIDDQSNSSLISSGLADELGAVGPEEKYYLTTCSGDREIKYGWRVTGVTIQPPNGAMSDLPTLIECDNIPHDKREIPTPEMARRFPHLQEIASEIPPKAPTFIFSSGETLQNFLKFESSETDPTELHGHKGFL